MIKRKTCVRNSVCVCLCCSASPIQFFQYDIHSWQWNTTKKYSSNTSISMLSYCCWQSSVYLTYRRWWAREKWKGKTKGTTNQIYNANFVFFFFILWNKKVYAQSNSCRGKFNLFIYEYFYWSITLCQAHALDIILLNQSNKQSVYLSMWTDLINALKTFLIFSIWVRRRAFNDTE